MRNKAVVTGLILLMATSSLAQTTADISVAREHLNKWREKRSALWMNDFGDLQFYRDADRALAANPEGQRRVVFLGDSITLAWSLDEFFPGKGYINRGIGGQTTSQMVLRFQQDVIALRPTVVVILAGTNDIAGNTGIITEADIEANLATMAELAKIHHISVIFSSITPVNNYAPSKDMYVERPQKEILDVNRWLKDYCDREGLTYLDYYSRLIDDAGMLRRGLSKGDGLHPNEKCYSIMASLASAAIAKALPVVRN